MESSVEKEIAIVMRLAFAVLCIVNFVVLTRSPDPVLPLCIMEAVGAKAVTIHGSMYGQR
jgi:hypothetical protein